MTTIPKSKLNTVKNLYYEKGNSMNDIASKLGVSLKSVIYFMQINNLKRRNYQEANNNFFQHKPLSFNIKKQLKNKERELLIKAVMIYWCEGAKGFKTGTVDFANCNPEMLKIFMLFLRKICRVDESRIRIYMYCYSNQNIERNIKYWSYIVNVPISQFTKPYIRNDFRKDKINKMPHGMIHIRYADKKLLKIINDWIIEYSK